MSILERETFFKLFGRGSFYGEPSIFMGLNDIEPILAFIQTFHLKTIIEFGIQRGATAKFILNNCPSVENYIGIDITPDAQTTLPIQQIEVPQIAGELVKDYHQVNLILTPNGTRDLTPGHLPAADLILIDGDHSADGVLLDTILARQTIRKGGIICWHDYGNLLVPDVTKVIDELNIKEGNRIFWIENGFLCFQICREGRE